MITPNASPVFVQAPAEKGVALFSTDFLMGGVSVAAPIKRVKLLIQNKDEMIKTVLYQTSRRTVMATGRGFRETWSGASSLFFFYSLDYARTPIANDAKDAKKGGERQFNGVIDIYRKTLTSDGVAGLYRGLYFGMYDSLKPVLLTGRLHGT
ncbi:hypothetical protein CQW23_29577 [Capsicum baccatum]|uniref:ADP/ATP translocase n=1 Tax=Capsicum baccatum TaxID=33114 RepID=A0A2G2VJU9_CAPBA|nr:hypothetical protein CQW23_29577 [Capsicum baccatum]